MTRAAQRVAQLDRKGGGIKFAKMTVDAVREDGTVNLSQGQVIHLGIPCFNSYMNRQAGDTVTVVQWSGGWCVLGKNDEEFIRQDPDPVTISWGTSPPAGSGWVTGDIWVREKEIYVQTAAPDPPPAPPSKPSTIQPTSQGAWRGGSRDYDQAPTQGAWSSYPYPYTGAWFYDDAVVNAAAGRTIDSVAIRLARTSKSHGIYGSVRPLLHLINAGSAGSSTPALNSPSSPLQGPALGLGGSATFTLPSSWRDALVAGQARGIGITAGVGDSYLICTSSCGQLTLNAA